MQPGIPCQSGSHGIVRVHFGGEFGHEDVVAPRAGYGIISKLRCFVEISRGVDVAGWIGGDARSPILAGPAGLPRQDHISLVYLHHEGVIASEAGHGKWPKISRFGKIPDDDGISRTVAGNAVGMVRIRPAGAVGAIPFAIAVQASGEDIKASIAREIVWPKSAVLRKQPVRLIMPGLSAFTQYPSSLAVPPARSAQIQFPSGSSLAR